MASHRAESTNDTATEPNYKDGRSPGKLDDDVLKYQSSSKTIKNRNDLNISLVTYPSQTFIISLRIAYRQAVVYSSSVMRDPSVNLYLLNLELHVNRPNLIGIK